MSLHPFFAEELVRKWTGHHSLFAEKDPASAPTLPGHGPINSGQDIDMNSAHPTPAPTRSASVPDWYEIASEYEIALGNIRTLVELAEEVLSGDGREQTPGEFVMPIATFLQTHALLSAMRTMAKAAMEPAK